MLQSIQNNALSIIFKIKREFGNKALHELAKQDNIKVRSPKLKDRYLEKAVCQNKPIITEKNKRPINLITV